MTPNSGTMAISYTQHLLSKMVELLAPVTLAASKVQMSAPALTWAPATTYTKTVLADMYVVYHIPDSPKSMPS